MKVIEIKNLKKYYKDVKAVDDLSFNVRKGELFAFLGLNGAGKSTTINIICGCLDKDSGSVIVDGYDIEKNLDKIKAKIGIVFQNSMLDKNLTCRDNLMVRGALYGLSNEDLEKKIEELSSLLDLKEIINKPLGKLSGGQRRKVDIARALIHNPSILILDEPTTGLDPQTRIMVWSVINKLRKEGDLTVFLTTHYMEEASDADYVVILDSGKVAGEGTPNDLKNKYASDFIKLYFKDEEKDKILKMLKKEKLNYKEYKDFFEIEVSNISVAKDLIINYTDLFNDFEVIKGKMDNVFLNVTGKEIKEVI